ncbi:2-phosphosulfolactate phosphatase [Actinoalloteichus hoggarensis]|uniref:Probable 2-phosphosulfolactate phosphatase n=1 Tax=Actinoalloteichus hoggarensis TaxID=1470176 RepID=A0A221W044_9PSEU|nr:2-phosphosulfolactate phosphatase [Actinoalloteichus hoggarensis]ASO19140.1 2-phosphosulfolactate phosphatase [Actinoalloteichus hoggarensis]MBB5920376.1 2-phosphosulfolactate phosphatase [Actinoalloteichus hoggarensis]
MTTEHVLRQEHHRIRSGWGEAGLAALADDCAVVIVVDVLSFSTAVDVALGRGARVLPLRWRDERAAEAAAAAGATLAGPRGGAGWSLSPTSLHDLPAGRLLALPSPNGATLCAAAATRRVEVLVGCLRNASATAHRALESANGAPIAVIAAGERWGVDDGPLRVAVEDLLGAGAVIAALSGGTTAGCSPEAAVAEASFLGCRDRLGALIADCTSGRELRDGGYAADVEQASRLDVSRCAPRLVDGVLVHPATST